MLLHQEREVFPVRECLVNNSEVFSRFYDFLIKLSLSWCGTGVPKVYMLSKVRTGCVHALSSGLVGSVLGGWKYRLGCSHPVDGHVCSVVNDIHH